MLRRWLKLALPAWLSKADMQLLYKEIATHINSPDGAALGIVCMPDEPVQAANIGVVFISGGYQYRAGSHRQTVRLSRHLASAGITSLRFDLAGLGDATGTVVGFENLTPQLLAAIKALTQLRPEIQRIVLWGLCDGASAALLHLHNAQDPRIVGLALVNPWVRSESTLASTHVRHYYLRRLREKAFWQKLLSGQIGVKAAQDLTRNLSLARQAKDASSASFQERMASAWREFDGAILLLISGDDITGQEFMETARQSQSWDGCMQRSGLTHVTLSHADHTCSTVKAHDALMQTTASWLLHLSQRLT